MRVRPATKWDLHSICDMLRNYRSQTPWPRLAECDNESHIMSLLSTILAGMGVMFVSEKDYEITGMLLAIKQPNIWDPDLLQMNELAYWVEPEHRGSTAGYKLIKTYQTYCEDLIKQGKLESYTISKMVNSPDLDYGRFGFKKQEEMWRK